MAPIGFVPDPPKELAVKPQCRFEQLGAEEAHVDRILCLEQGILADTGEVIVYGPLRQVVVLLGLDPGLRLPASSPLDDQRGAAAKDNDQQG